MITLTVLCIIATLFYRSERGDFAQAIPVFVPVLSVRKLPSTTLLTAVVEGDASRSASSKSMKMLAGFPK
jgi:hypothetical protein